VRDSFIFFIHEGKMLLGKSRHGSEDIIKINLKEGECGQDLTGSGKGPSEHRNEPAGS
jgi:hypothetical protein